MNLASILLKIALSFITLDDISNSEPLRPIKLVNYNETVIVYKNGNASSHISLQLNDTCTDLYLPLLINKKVVLVNAPINVQTVVLGLAQNQVLHLSTTSNKPLVHNIQIDLSYNNYIEKDHFWDFEQPHNLLMDYTDLENGQLNIGDFSAKIVLPPDFTLKPQNNSTKRTIDQVLTIDYIKSDLNNEIYLTASNLNFVDIDIVMTINNSSRLLTSYFLIIVLLISVYAIFLRYIFAG